MQLLFRVSRDPRTVPPRSLGVRPRLASSPLTFAIPLYLLKIEMIPRETAWLPSLVFLGFIFPARTLTGWAYARSGRREQPRHWFFRWTSRLGMFSTGLIYALIVYFTQFTAWQGIWSLYEQHAFMLPVPFSEYVSEPSTIPHPRPRECRLNAISGLGWNRG